MYCIFTRGCGYAATGKDEWQHCAWLVPMPPWEIEQVWDMHVEVYLMKSSLLYVLLPTYLQAHSQCRILTFSYQQSLLSSETPFFCSTEAVCHFHPHLFICFACSALILLWHLRFPLTKRVLTSRMKWTGIRKCMLYYLQYKRWPVLLKKVFQGG